MSEYQQSLSDHIKDDDDENIDDIVIIDQSKELCLKGISKYAKDKQIRKDLQHILGDHMVSILSIVKPKLKSFCFLTFESLTDKQAFMNLIEETQKSVKNNKKLRVGNVNKQDRRQPKPPQKPVKPWNREQKQCVLSPEELIKQTAQLYNLSYEEQVNFKQNELMRVLQNYQKIYLSRIHNDEDVPKWISSNDITKLVQIEDPITCEQQRTNYRNKSEFTIGLNNEGKITVGFNYGSYNTNNACVLRSEECVVTPAISISLSQKFEEYIQSKFESQGLQHYNRSTGQGFWRIFTVRKSSRTMQLLIIISVNKNGGTEEQYQQIREELLSLFDISVYTLKGIVVLNSTQLVADYPESDEFVDVVFGTPYFDEQILGKQFRISYNGFMQNHIEQCDKLYQKISDISRGVRGQPIFLDVCAGSGTIGLCVAKQMKEVVAIEMNRSSCIDAEVNYKLNGVDNCRMICSKVEDVMKGLSNELKCKQQGSHFIGCLDPPRAGVLPSVIDALRTFKGLDDIIYVSCSPSQVVDNLIALTLPQSKRRKAPGFRLKSVVLVDMFPQTNHYEVIFHLERDYLDI